ncbi:tetratricopeptide repeat protein [Flagellimonas meridianipacifica]|uniref:Uncharacterized protein n=1 Tax=Flagellimonas meridianipacifica TaxID=1080225 RepID=A0A2T0MA14_9FLAO|nr:hypothetical protein [Allomuricauda pacifica]PRX54319.1 hypothetical protein CLV81_2719 [Allomuricauda pacifica]
MKRIFTLLALALLISCSKEKTSITNINDYNKYLKTSDVENTSKFFELWNGKIKSDSLQTLALGNVAKEYGRFFKTSGDIEYLKNAERALKKALDEAAIGKSGYLRALARNYIAQHRFKEALVLAQKAREMGSGVNASQSLLFDLHMELGNYTTASKYLDSIQNLSDFGYLIRVAKWNDHKGDLETAIRFMEKAKEKADSSKNLGLRLWAYTNLADFYGHDGRIEDAYGHYLMALQLDSNNAYAKKGIAWIVFSYERNPQEALRIIEAVERTNQSPDLDLFKAEVAEYIGNEEIKAKALEDFHTKVQNSSYGIMYNTHKIEYYLGKGEVTHKALEIANAEITNRSTPETYDLLAYSYLQDGKNAKAMELMETHVKGKTFEPMAQYHMAQIYKANGYLDDVEALKEELMEASFELGPNMEKAIQEL